MLDTGIDIPEVVNLVFFKAVRSKSKFWQMIGRGTRLCVDLFGPGEDKQDFLVFDFCGNLEYFSQDLPGSEGSTQKSLTQRIVEARIDLVRDLADSQAEAALREATAGTLHVFVAGMNLDNFLVRPHRRQVERFAAPVAWESFGPDDADAARTLAGLPSADRDDDEDAKRFDLVILRRQLAQLEGDAATAERLRETVQAVAVALLGKTTIPAVAEQAVLLEAVGGDEWWVDVTLPMLEVARLRLRGLVHFVEKTRRNPVYTDFVDELGEATSVELPGITPGTDFERFRAKAAAYLRQHDDNLALRRLRRNKQLTESDLAALEAMLVDAGAHPDDLDRAAAQTGGLGLFVRSLVGLDREAAVEAFARYLDGGSFTVEQVRFVNLIVDELTSNGAMEPARLFESPFTDHAPTGPDYVFELPDVDAIVGTLRHITQHAVPSGAA
jgi:type I restriction enzyme R subunit